MRKRSQAPSAARRRRSGSPATDRRAERWRKLGAGELPLAGPFLVDVAGATTVVDTWGEVEAILARRPLIPAAIWVLRAAY